MEVIIFFLFSNIQASDIPKIWFVLSMIETPFSLLDIWTSYKETTSSLLFEPGLELGSEKDISVWDCDMKQEWSDERDFEWEWD